MCVIKDKDGRIVAGGMRPKVKPYEPGSETERLAKYEAAQRNTAESWDKYFGHAYSIIERREKIVAFKFYLDNSRMVVVTTEPDYPPQKAGLLLEIVNKFVGETSAEPSQTDVTSGV